MKKMTALMAMLLCSLALFAQSHSYTPGQVAFSPVFDASFAGFPAEVCSVMETKLTQIVMNNGCGSFSDRYAITARLVVEDKEVTATVPARYKVDMHVQLIAVDLEKGVMVGEYTQKLAGIGDTENKAIMAAVRRLNPGTPAIAAFVRNASVRIVETFNQGLDRTMTDIRDLASAGKFDDAFAKLAEIPSDIDRYEEVQELSREVYAAYTHAKAVAAAAAKARAEEQAALRAEERQREVDNEIRLMMARAEADKAAKINKVEMITKVGGWLLGSLV